MYFLSQIIYEARIFPSFAIFLPESIIYLFYNVLIVGNDVGAEAGVCTGKIGVCTGKIVGANTGVVDAAIGTDADIDVGTEEENISKDKYNRENDKNDKKIDKNSFCAEPANIDETLSRRNGV